jgi:hypothetical protein
MVRIIESTGKVGFYGLFNGYWRTLTCSGYVVEAGQYHIVTIHHEAHEEHEDEI